jgi:hypothetical protein
MSLRPQMAAPGDWYLVDAGPLTWIAARSGRDAAELALLPEFGPSKHLAAGLGADAGSEGVTESFAPGEIIVYQLDDDGDAMAVLV